MSFYEKLSNLKKQEQKLFKKELSDVPKVTDDKIQLSSMRGELSNQYQSSSYENQSKQSNNTSQNNSQENQNSSDVENDTVKFSDIAKDYKKRPFSQKAKSNLERTLQNIIDSSQIFAEMVDETFQEFYEAFYFERMSENDYIDSKNELQTIILEHKNAIENEILPYLQKKYLGIMGLFIKEDTKLKLNQFINEYQKKLEMLDMNYRQAHNYWSKWVEQKPLLSEDFNRRIQKVDVLFKPLRDKIERGEILSDNEEWDLIEWKYWKIQDWLEKTKISNRGMAFTWSYGVVKDRRNLVFKLGTIDYLNALEMLYNELCKYDGSENLSTMIDQGILNESNFSVLRQEFYDKYESLISKKRFADYHEPEKTPWVYMRERDCYGLFDAVSKQMKGPLLCSNSWNALLDSISSLKKEERPLRLQELYDKLKPIEDFLKDLDTDVLNDQYLLDQKKSLPKLDEFYQLIKTVQSKIEEEEKLGSLNEYEEKQIKNIKDRCRYFYGCLDAYKEVIEFLASLVDYFDFLRKINDQFEEVIQDLETLYRSLMRNYNDQDFTLYESKYNEMKSLLDELLLHQVTLSPEFCKEPYARNLYQCRNLTDKYVYDFIGEIFGDDTYFDLHPYFVMKIMKGASSKLLKTHSPERVLMSCSFSKYIKTIKKIDENIEGFLREKRNGNVIDWQMVISEKNLLCDILEKITPIVNLGQDTSLGEKDSLYFEYLELYKKLHAKIEKIPTTDEEFLVQLKLDVLKMLKEYKKYQKRINENEDDVLPYDDVANYSKYYYEYLMSSASLMCLSGSSSDIKNDIIRAQIKGCQVLLDELVPLEPRNSGGVSYEKEEICWEMKKLQRKLFSAEAESNNPKIDPNLLWKQKKLETELCANPNNTQTFLEYLEVTGKVAKEKYLSESSQENDEVSNCVRDISSLKASLNAQRQVLCTYAERNAFTKSFLEQQMNAVNGALTDCEDQLRILTL